MASTVTPEQIEKLNYVIGPKATSLAAAVIRLHCAGDEEKKWVYTGLCGALCFIIDRQMGGVAVFRMYDLNSFSLLFEAELYFEFDKYYIEVNDNFYCFPIPGKHFIGFSFADSDEALMIKSYVNKYSPKHNYQEKFREKTKKMTKTEQNAPGKQSFFKRIFTGKKKQKNQDEDDDIDDLKISRPENAVHENHIGWDPKNQTFDLSQLSKELKRVFKKAGIRKKDLKDTNTALLIADAILNQPIPDIISQRKKVLDKPSSKKDFDEQSESRRSSGFSPSLKPISITSQANGGDPLKKNISIIDKKTHNLSKQDEISLTTKLASAIAQRRKQLTKHDVESEEDDWSDDDI